MRTRKKGVETMFNRKTINETRVATSVTTILIAVVALLFVMSFANQAAARGKMDSLKGEVVAVDGYNKTLTVKSIESSQSSPAGMEGEFVFDADRNTNVIWCSQNKTFEDIRAGDKVTVTYHERGGRLVADAIDIPPVVLACYQ